MSKITKALEKIHHDMLSNGMTRDGGEAPPPQSAPDEMSYTQTQVVEQGYSALEPGQMISNGEDMGLTDCYAMLRTEVLHRTREGGQNTIMVTSVGPGEGKTLTAINLAMSMAKEMVQTALLVDMNLRAPMVASYLSLDVERGLTDYLVDNVPLPELLINPGMNKLIILPAGKPLAVSTEILGSPKMRHLVREMKTKYPERYVIFDCPHLLGMPDSLIFSTFVDHIILVVEAGKTSSDDLTKTLHLLKDKPLLGIVLNRVQGT